MSWFDIIRVIAGVAQLAGHIKAKKNLKILLEEETVIRQAYIIWVQNKILPVNGNLQLTNIRLRYLSDHDDYFSYSLKDIVSVEFNKYLGILPQGLVVTFSDGRAESFGVTKREEWANAILVAQSQIGAAIEPERTSDGTLLDYDLIATRQKISRYFNYDEIKTICFDLGVDYDTLPGGNKDEKARELVAVLDKNDRLSLMLKRAMELRPKVVWY